MPTIVPTYNRQREMPSGPNSLPSVRQTAAPTADQLGGNARVPTDYVGRGLQSAAGDFGKIAMQMQEREDADLIFRAETVLKDAALKKSLEWTERRGVQAWDVTKEASTWWGEEAPKLAEGLNERQRRIFDQTVAKYRSQSLESVSKHEAGQRRQSLDESAQASIVSSTNFAAANANNPVAIDTARADIDKRVRARAAIQGWAPERTEIERQNALTTMHQQVLETLADADPDAAEAYLAKYGGEIAGAKRDDAKKLVETSSRLKKVQSFADEAIARGMDEGAAIAEARKRFSGEDEKFAVAEVRSRFVEQDQARNRAQREVAEQVYGIYAQTRSLSAIPPSLVAKMDPKDWVALQNSHAARVSADASRVAAQASRQDAATSRAYAAEQRALEEKGAPKYYEIITRAPEQLAEMSPVDIAQLQGTMSRNQIDDIARRVASAKGGQKDPKAVTDSQVNTMLAPYLKAEGLVGTKKAKKAGQVTLLVRQRIAERQAMQDKPLTRQEIQQEIDGLFMDGTVPGVLWDSDVKKWEVLGTDDEGKWQPKKTQASGVVKAPDAPPVRVNSKAERDKLPAGTRYIHPDGTVRVKQ